MRLLYLVGGWIAMGLGVVGLFLPLMPTVPFMLLAAFFFAKGNPAWEARLLADPRFGPHILAWRTRGAIPRVGKIAAVIGLTGSAAMGLYLLDQPWRFVPLGVAIVCATWILTRPTA